MVDAQACEAGMTLTSLYLVPKSYMIIDFQNQYSFHWGNFFTECKISNNMAAMSGAMHVKFGMEIDHKYQHSTYMTVHNFQVTSAKFNVDQILKQ